MVEAFAAYYLGLVGNRLSNPKGQRLAMVAEAYDLRDLRAHLEGHPRHPEWVALRDRWDAACQLDNSVRRKSRQMTRKPKVVSSMKKTSGSELGFFTAHKGPAFSGS